MLPDVDDREGVGMKEIIALCLLILTVSCVARGPEACHDPVEKPVVRGLTT